MSESSDVHRCEDGQKGINIAMVQLYNLQFNNVALKHGMSVTS